MRFNLLQIVLLIVLVIIPDIARSQTGPVKKRYKKGTIQLQNRQSYTGEGLVFDSGQLTFMDTKDSQPVTFPLDDIKYIKAQTGSYALESALIGAALAGLSVALAYAEAGSDPFKEVKEERIPIVVGVFVLGGAGIGALFKKEKVIFKDNKFVTDIFIRNENLTACKGYNVTSVGIRLNISL